MATSRVKWALPPGKAKGVDSLSSGEEFSPKMTGAFYASSLEWNLVATPQYLNAGDLVAPRYSEVENIFKPKHPKGTFGSVVSDYDESEYRFDVGRSICELQTVEETVEVADSIGLESGFYARLEECVSYTTPSGGRIGYKEAVALQASFREHNNRIQRQIEDLVIERGYGPRSINGKTVRQKYPEALVSEIAKLASQKKAITGFNLKIQVVGKHTIAKGRNYVQSSISDEDLASLRRRLDYLDKTNYVQGNVRVGTVVVPIQSVLQLKRVKELLLECGHTIPSRWPERVQASCIGLVRVYE